MFCYRVVGPCGRRKCIVRARRSRDWISGIAQIVAGLQPAELADHDIAVELVVQASGRLDSAVGCADLDRVPLGDPTRVGRFEQPGKLPSGPTAAQGRDLSVLVLAAMPEPSCGKDQRAFGVPVPLWADLGPRAVTKP